MAGSSPGQPLRRLYKRRLAAWTSVPAQQIIRSRRLCSIFPHPHWWNEPLFPRALTWQK